MIRVVAWNNENFARSLLLDMPGYTFPLTGAFILEGRRSAGATGDPDFVFSTAKGNARIIATDAPNEQATLALFEKLSLVNDLSGLYSADLIYTEGGETANVGSFIFEFRVGVTATPIPTEPDYDDVAAWGPITDLAGESEATVLQFLQRGLTGPEGPPGSGGGVTDHGALTGLADDDHTQYHTDARGDARYAQISHAHAISDVTGLQTALDGKAATASLATVATSGAYADLSGTPTLGDAAAKNTGTTTGTVAAGDDSRITGAAQKSANLSDLANAATARANLGLGSLATRSTVDNADWSGTALSVANGGTGTATPALVAGTNVTITGTWPNQTINASSGSSYSAGGGLTLTGTTFSLGDGSGVTYSAANKALTVGGATVTTSNPVLSLSQTWNAGAVTFTGIDFNVTDTASGSASKVIDLRKGGTSIFSVDKNGAAYVRTGGYNSEGIFFGASGTKIWGSASTIGFNFGGAATALVTSGGYLVTGGYYGMGPGGASTADLTLYRVAADVFGQYRSTNAQSYQLYRTRTDASNYQRLTLGWSTSTALVMNEGAGTGADGSIAFNDAALATDATKGFLMIPSCAGTPTGTPADIPAGQVPIVWDSTNLKLYVYTGGAWKASAAFT